MAKFWFSKSIFYVKNYQNLSKKNFIEEYHLWSTFFVVDIFWQLQFLNHFIFWNDVKFLMIFTQLTARLKNFLMGWLLVLGLKEGLVECATLCVKSEVILTRMHLFVACSIYLDEWLSLLLAQIFAHSSVRRGCDRPKEFPFLQ